MPSSWSWLGPIERRLKEERFSETDSRWFYSPEGLFRPTPSLNPVFSTVIINCTELLSHSLSLEVSSLLAWLICSSWSSGTHQIHELFNRLSCLRKYPSTMNLCRQRKGQQEPHLPLLPANHNLTEATDSSLGLSLYSDQ